MNFLEINNISAGFEEDLFTHQSFELTSGEAIQILGANGCGKTTLLRSIMGLFSLRSGHVSWFGFDMLKNDYEAQSAIAEHVCYQPFDLALKKQLTVFENLDLYLSSVLNALQKASKQERKNNITKVLDDFNLSHLTNKLCKHLSSGQLRRLSLCKLLLNPVKVWVLDEPFSAVDKKGIVFIQHLINEHLALGGSVLFTSHQDITLNVPIKKVQL